MSQFGLTGIPILDNNAMGGFRGGMADHRSLLHSNNQLETEDLAQDEAIQRIEKNKLNTPLEAAERALKLAEAQKLQAEMDQGLWEKDRARKREMEAADLQKKLSDVQIQQLETRLKGMDATNNIFGPDADPAKLAMSWETSREEGKRYGFDIGEYNQQNVEKYMRMRNQAPLMQKLYYDNVKRQEDLKVNLIEKGAEANYKSAEAQRHEGWQGRENALNRANTLAAAKIRADDGSGDPSTWTGQKAKAFRELEEFEKTGKPPSEAALVMLEQEWVTKQAVDRLKMDPSFKLIELQMGSKDPAVAEKAEAKAVEMIESKKRTLPAYQLIQKARATKAGGAAPAAGAAAPAATTKPTVDPARAKALRDKYLGGK